MSEIRVPGSQERLWLGSYSAPEAAAVAHDIAYYCLREKTSPENFNFFPLVLPGGVVERGMSPRAIQKAAADAGMAVDAQIIAKQITPISSNISQPSELDISVEDYL